MLDEVLKPFSIKVRKIVLIAIGSLTWSITMVKSGWEHASLGLNGPGLGFWGANGHDGIWHIALSESLSRGSLSMPIFAGAKLQNYHIGFDLLLALLHQITSISIANLYFQILPPIFAISIGLLAYWFIWNWTNSAKAAWWSTFLVYFGGSFGWLIGRGESVFWSQQAVSTLINPPFSLSLIFILVGLILIKKLEKTFTLITYISSVLVFGSLIEIKAYAGILALGALLVLGLFTYIFQKKSLFLKIFCGSLIISIVLYLPLNIHAGGLLVFAPFWFLESMMGLTDRVNFTKFYSAMLNYKSGHVWGKALLAYGIAFLVFILGNFGTRIIFLFRKIKIDTVSIFIYSIIFAGILIPLIFVQKGTPWNTIQFFYYSLFFSSLLAGTVIGNFLENSKLNNSLIYIIELFLILFTIPTTILTLRDVYIPIRPPAMLKMDEVSALKYLSYLPDGIVLTKPFDDFAAKVAENNPPRPLYLYTSTAYVSAFGKHQTFLEDENNLNITGFDWEIRKKQVLDWYNEKEMSIKRQFLITNRIKYIYWIKEGQSPLDLAKMGVKNIYENDSVTIYMVE